MAASATEPPPHLDLSEEQSARADRLFQFLDEDKDGAISVRELAPRLRALSRAIGGPAEISDEAASKYAAELIDLAESGKKDGRVTRDEFRDFIFGKEARLRALFDSVDTSKDGQVDKAELVAAMGRVGIKLAENDLAKFVATVDRDGSGDISFEEFRNFCLVLPTGVDLVSVFQQFQQLYDPNMNLEITPQQPGGFTWNGFLAGAIAGAASRTSTAPFDRLRVFFQNGGGGAVGGGNAFVAAARQIYSQGGLKGFWRGNGLNVLKVAPESAIMFAALDSAKRTIASWEGKSEKALSPQGKFLAGSIAGLVAQTLTYPLDSLKIRLMSNVATTASGAAKASDGGVVGVFRDMLAEGPSAFFRGIVPASIGVIPYAGINLGVHENLKTWYQARNPEVKEIPVVAILGIGCFSGSVACVAVYPLQVIRTRMQSQGSPSNPNRYSGIGDCVRQTAAREGPRGFYKGLVATLTKVVPSAGVSFASFEMAKRWLNVK
ncbi:mitochondrial carrier domain-containing protein [Hyaloraphidium curvatum]|nr:mitochondrial carrier domain-containing protein [Hyaloraphidium curvatum]